MKPQNLLTSIFLLPFVGIMGLLTGCGGGGGSKDSAGITFTKWSDINPPATVTVNGISEDADYVAVGDIITDITDKGFSTNASASITYQADMTISKISVRTPNGTVTWDAAAGDLFGVVDPVQGIIGAVRADESSAALAMDPLATGWDYQTFGSWATGIGASSGALGTISVGALTPPSAIPTQDGATFQGATLGGYVDASGTFYPTTSLLTVTADFAGRSLDFVSTGTRLISATVVNGEPKFSFTFEDGLNLTGNLKYQVGENSFVGDLTTAGSATVGVLTGPAEGRFYGPNAEELGGVFAVKGAGVESYGGSFGAIQTP